ncbi:flagellar protein FlaG [Noviherbaspirillum sp. UKPF54]|uniref:flagellar protein FlaG n=1 Tax=Noviherbaspirillum sp. UKPF54 TaxID=2601898 RepID=UPI00143CD7A1|nr:flagellar protein FlaG [Noviherbaspirillum sp. UKPF54]
MDIKPVGNTAAQPGQRISETGNFAADLPSIAARQAATPVQTVDAVQQPASIPSMNQTHEALKQINDTMKKLSQDLEFTVDEDSERPIVKVVDQQTKEVIRQIPTQEALEIAKALDRVQGLLIRQKA